jgi:D-alanyl-D-alanine carboxypeptidase (penicillin-binding protein 5/6)
MTAYITLRQYPLEPGQSGFVLTVTKADVAEERKRVSEDQSVIAVKAGERLTERQALLALMLPSANNLAAMLAVHDAGSVSAFVRRMNAQARALRMTSTTYTDPSGFESTTVSTPADQVMLAEAAMRIPAFAAIVDRRAASLPVVGPVVNYNGLVGREGYVGVKTGSDSAAGGCLVFAKRITVDGHRRLIIGAVLGQRKGEIIQAAIVSARRLGNSAAQVLRAPLSVGPFSTRGLKRPAPAPIRPAL